MSNTMKNMWDILDKFDTAELGFIIVVLCITIYHIIAVIAKNVGKKSKV